MSSGPSGIVLTGGGARGAYQAGALLALAEITGAKELPFPVLAGSSAGSINCTYLASRADDFAQATRDLADFWTTLEPSQVFRTDAPTLAKTAAEWLADLSLGAWIGTGRGRALLDTKPLAALIEARLDTESIERHIQLGRVHGVAVTATNYDSGLAVTFFQGHEYLVPWNRITRVAVRAKLGVQHVLASSAIPIFFPAVEIDGDWYADGCIRLATPLSPAIRMGAQRIVAIATRHAATAQPPSAARHPYPTAAEAVGVLLDALFVDALETDVERALRINHTLSFVPEDVRASHVIPLRQVDLLVLRPSQDLGSLVLTTIDHFPATVRHLFRGLGASDVAGWDLLSYLAFEGSYATRLLDLGFDDTVARADEIRRFLA